MEIEGGAEVHGTETGAGAAAMATRRPIRLELFLGLFIVDSPRFDDLRGPGRPGFLDGRDCR
jgi:hypothetical protein